MNSRTKTRISKTARNMALTMLLCAAPLSVLAALTDIASVPLASSSTTVVKPNILFTLDDSGSMEWGFMPDNVESRYNTTGYKNHLCNTIYYNPAITYVPPKNADGTDFANASFTAARYNGFDSGSSTRNLSTSFIAFDDNLNWSSGTDTAQPAYYYVWSGTGTPSSSSTSSTTGCWPGSSNSFPHSTGNWTKVRVSTTSGPGLTDERQNFANWYSYYRQRMLLMKSATGRAFVSIGEGYRVGFITINPGSPVVSSRYLAIADFTATQKSNWFTKLYSQGFNGSTPLREALSRAGRHFAGIQTGINNGMTGDPMQYSCQQNFSIFTSDGYWNGNSGDDLNGNSIGNHDGNIATNPRPMFDGSVTTTYSRRYKSEEVKAQFDCSSGRTRIREITTTMITPILPTPGAEAQQGSPSQSYVTSCSKSTRNVQTPNPQYTTPETLTSTSGGASGTLADVAAYYYMTDLRGPGSTGSLGTDVGTDNNVPSSGTGPEDDKAKHQHMTTFTMGLGLAGTLNYVPNYKTGAGDFAALRSGSKNWPAPSQNDPTALDDLWHAAVNGRGQFFSAADPDSVVESLTTALAGVNARVASAAAAATSNLEPVAGDNFAYTASYKTLEWIGELEAKEIDLTTGNVGTTPVWSARAKLDNKTGAACDNRDIRLFRSGATNNLVNFTWNTQTCDASKNPTGAATTGLNASEQAFFGATQVADLSQYPDMTNGILPLLSVNQRGLAAGANMVNFLRGHRGREAFETDSQQLYRTRTAVLGDIVNAQPVFARAPFADYQDTGYAGFKSSNTNRTPMVYVAANDGMLHAFYAGTNTTDPLGGEERWAFIPTMVVPNLYKLADNNYGTLHRYSVDGTPTIADVFDPSASPTAPNYGWKTILVGGLNAGGKGYYALDVTDPANPKGLWEFKHNTTCLSPVTGQSSDCHLGYSFGNPQIGKLADGRWVVFVTSGYNNVNSPAATGDGIGYLYVLNALTGQIIYKISTSTGSAATPSGLGKINTFVLDTVLNNTVQHLYGVDLLGNVWRFEVNASQTATRLTTVTDASNNPQPITTKPELAEFGSPPVAHVFVSSGKYIGASDLASTQSQSVWAIKDTGSYPVATPRSTLSRLTITNSGDGLNRSIACATNCTNNGGWFADLPDSGERVNVDMKLQLGTLVVASNVPQNNACNIGGYSWLNFFDARNGLQIAGSANFGSKLSESLAVGINVVRLPDGRTVVIATTSDASQQTAEAPIPAGDPQGRRTSWRELVQ
jgi:type IV pilus assembly protein PilY1